MKKKKIFAHMFGGCSNTNSLLIVIIIIIIARNIEANRKMCDRLIFSACPFSEFHHFFFFFQFYTYRSRMHVAAATHIPRIRHSLFSLVVKWGRGGHKIKVPTTHPTCTNGAHTQYTSALSAHATTPECRQQ